MPEVLMRRIREGDEAAFADLYRQYSEYALRVAAAVTKDKDAAADAVQETFFRIYKSAGSYDSDRPFKPWFYQILINECNRILKGKGKTVYGQDFVEDASPSAQNHNHSFEEYDYLYSAIKQLKDINRVPIILKYLEDFKETEIAEILGVNVNTVKARLFKGRRKLRKAIEGFEKRGEKHVEQSGR